MIVWLTACANPVADSAAPTPALLSGPRLLRRVSLDLTGELPSIEALDSVEASPEAWRDWAGAWLDDPRFEGHLVALLAERWHTRVDDFEVDAADYQLAPGEEYAYERAVGEEPLRLMAHVAASDAPWTDIVTANYTMGNDILAGIWPIRCTDGSGWRECSYTDGRPAAGVLATNGLWWRYPSTPSNLNRGRVAAIARLLVCEDLLARPVSFADVPPLTDAAAAAQAIRTEPACVACHSTIEPIAASLLGFYWTTQYSRIEETTYHPDREGLWAETLGVSPAWYGKSIEGLVELGPAIAADPRFSQCAVESAAEFYWRRKVAEADRTVLDSIRAGWNGNYKALFRAISDTPQYQALDNPDEVGVRLLSPAQLSGALAALTGFTWTYDGFDQMDNDTFGFRILAGGVDGEAVSRAQTDPGLTWALVVKRLAEAAAQTVVAHDLGQENPTLLTSVGAETTPGDSAFSDQVQTLGWQLYGERIDSGEVTDFADLWASLAEESGSAEAWTGVLAVMFRDTRMVTY